MPGLVKIGCTDRPIEERLRELSASSGVPVAFECFMAVEVSDYTMVEAALHRAFGDRRLNPRREFFELSPDRPAAILALFEGQGAKNVTPKGDVVESPEEQQALDRERERRAKFRFSQVGITPGSELKSAFDPNQTCIVLDDRAVKFRGERTSLSKSASIIARETGRNWKSVQGPQFWTYEGKSLTEMREDDEGEEG